jgi:hypothetical protein
MQYDSQKITVVLEGPWFEEQVLPAGFVRQRAV